MTDIATETDEFICRLHAAPGELVLAVTGGGSGAISALLTHSGATRTVLEAIVPYAPAALVEWLGARPEQFCSARTARAMAMAGLLRAERLTAARANEQPPLAGLACTASLASDRPKRGPHRLFVALQTTSVTACWELELAKGARSREAEESLATCMILNAAAEYKALSAENRLRLALRPDEVIAERRVVAPPAWQRLLATGSGAVCAVGEQGLSTEAAMPAASLPRALLPGAFNPLHDGHRTMLAMAERRLGCPIACEISITNVDKPPLDYIEMTDRAAQFARVAAQNNATADGALSLWFTAAPTFVEKAQRFPGATFVVGADTIVRVGLARYYGNSEAERDRALKTIAGLGCRFLVFGRLVGERFETLEELPLPENLRALCDGLTEAEFRRDISSTELRKALGANDF